MGNVTNVLVMRKEQAYKLREYFNAEGQLDFGLLLPKSEYDGTHDSDQSSSRLPEHGNAWDTMQIEAPDNDSVIYTRYLTTAATSKVILDKLASLGFEFMYYYFDADYSSWGVVPYTADKDHPQFNLESRNDHANRRYIYYMCYGIEEYVHLTNDPVKLIDWVIDSLVAPIRILTRRVPSDDPVRYTGLDADTRTLANSLSRHIARLGEVGYNIDEVSELAGIVDDWNRNLNRLVEVSVAEAVAATVAEILNKLILELKSVRKETLVNMMDVKSDLLTKLSSGLYSIKRGCRVYPQVLLDGDIGDVFLDFKTLNITLLNIMHWYETGLMVAIKDYIVSGSVNYIHPSQQVDYSANAGVYQIAAVLDQISGMLASGTGITNGQGRIEALLLMVYAIYLKSHIPHTLNHNEGELLETSLCKAKTIVATIKCNLLALSPELGSPEPGKLASYVKGLI